MLELLSRSIIRKSAKLPGNEALVAGSFQAGLYGSVPSRDFVTSARLVTHFGVTQGTTVDTSWLKFSHFGKILYIARTCVKREISWDHLYSRGLVYGVASSGHYPVGPSVSQYRTIDINGIQYKVRLMRGSLNDPLNNRSDFGHTGTEWRDLIVPAPGWLGVQPASLLTGTHNPTLCQETTSWDTARRLSMGQISITDNNWYLSNMVSGINSGIVWRPVLEPILN